jgi:hypothetical protein
MVFDSVRFNNPVADQQRAISRQFRASADMVKEAQANEQPEVVKELTHRPVDGFSEEQILLLLAQTMTRVVKSYGIKV